MGPQSARTISKHTTTQNGTPECNYHFKTCDAISKQLMTQNGFPECKNHIKTYGNTKWEANLVKALEETLNGTPGRTSYGALDRMSMLIRVQKQNAHLD